MITYTQWLNEGGTLEADLTVTKLDDERFWVVASDTAHRHAETWMRRHIPDDAHAFVTDVTSGYAQINMQGPRSRELMQSVTTRRPVERGVPVPHRARDRHRLRARAVRPHHLPRRARLRALHPDRAGDARLRPARRGGRDGRAAPRRPEGAGAACAWRRATATTATTSTTPTRCSRPGLGFAVDLKKPGGFIGKDAVLAKKADGPAQAAPRADARQGSRADAVPRRGRAPRRQAGRLHPRRVVRLTRSAARSAW